MILLGQHVRAVVRSDGRGAVIERIEEAHGEGLDHAGADLLGAPPSNGRGLVGGLFRASTQDSVIVTGAEREDGTSHHYLPAGSEVAADPELTARLASAAVRPGLAPRQVRAWTIDALYRETVAAITRHREAGVLVVEMEAAAIFAVAQVRGVRAALLVAISDELSGPGWGYGFSDTRYRDALLASEDAAMDCALELGA